MNLRLALARFFHLFAPIVYVVDVGMINVACRFDVADDLRIHTQAHQIRFIVAQIGQLQINGLVALFEVMGQFFGTPQADGIPRRAHGPLELEH